MTIFAKRLQSLIEENKITMYRVAKDLKYSKTTILNWCYETTEPKATDIVKLAIYFEVSTDYLLGLEDYTGGKIVNSFNNSFNGNNSNITIK